MFEQSVCVALGGANCMLREVIALSMPRMLDFSKKKLRIERLPPVVSGLAAAEAGSQTNHGDCRRGMEEI